MGFMRELFGPSKEEIWRQLCSEIEMGFTSQSIVKASSVTLVNSWGWPT